MANEIVIVISFIFTIAAMCKVWNLYAMKKYSESKEERLGLTYGFYVDNMQFVEIEGIGKAKRDALLRKFGTIEKIKNASIDELTQVKGINEKLAQKLKKM